MKHRAPHRGLTLLEVLFAMAALAVLMGLVMGIVVNSSRSFAREQGQTYTQFRVRTALDDLAQDIRAAVAVVPASGLPANTGAIVLEVPCCSASGIVYSGSPPSAETMVKDKVAYYVKDGVLSRKTTLGDSSSTRVAGTVVVAHHVSALTFQMRTTTGTTTSDVSKAAEVDLSATVGDTGGMQAHTVALTSVRMRNKRTVATS